MKFLQYSLGECLDAHEAGGNCREELQLASPFPCCPMNSECRVEEKPDRKKKQQTKAKLLRLNYYV